jgi:HD-GYP domain-containing protein (c-di-GMP phosphodiesterase class II)
MIKAGRYLKPAWVRRQFELAMPLLPIGSCAALQFGDKRLVEMNEVGHDLIEGESGVQTFPMMLEGEQVGALLLRLPAGSEIAQAETWGKFLAYTLQGMLESEHGRRSVTQETLESYREMALLQRATTDLNRSLEPTTVATALLKEFDIRKEGADCGAVFMRNVDGGLELMQCFGIAAADAFVKLASSEFFANIASQENGDYVNVLPVAPLWAGEVPEFESLLWQNLFAHGEHLGLLVLALQRSGGFTAADLKRAQTLCSVAATALHNAQLYAAEQKMFQSFVDVIATAIDAKSPYTAGHCRRVPEIALMIAEAAHKADSEPFADFVLDEDERNTMEIAAKLHDCGKVVTPEWVVDKATKLDRIENRIHLVALRFEVLRRDALIALYRALAEGAEREAAEAVYRERLRQLDEDFAFLEKCNTGAEFVSGEHIMRIESIARQCWSDACDEAHPLLTENEVYNLSIQRGTLNAEERIIIEDHATHTRNMLLQIAFPRTLHNVTDYAADHHERMDGKGYPRGRKGDELSIPARILAIADIFEALTAPDRPYRKPGKLSWAIDIMHRMKLDNHIDGDLFDLFLSERVYLAYANKHLPDSQIDDVDVSRYLAEREL